MKKIFCLILSLFLSVGVIAGTRDPQTPDSKYLDYGAKFHNVVVIHGEEKNGSMFFASAVVIDDHHILTAAHVVRNAEKCFVVIDKKSYKIVDIKCHKDFDNDKGLLQADIAIGYCDRKFGLDFYPELYDKEDEKFKICSICGFGLTGTFSTGAIHGDAQRRAGSNRIDSIEGDLLICSPSLNLHKTELEFLISSGDSGGGLFIDGKLAGINSLIMCDKGKELKSDYFTDSGHTRVSKYIDWILENKTK